ncbi:response regulator [Sphingomonas sp.]|uniref:response regulator n=1 Tax=Sphingomonas sp. TaxID=28214 RepID=UPI0025DAE63F|nr:response regulator [Sphingomonas sp.]MBV9527366.1 response regulator [Sphingomonas sp.]
MTTQELRNTHDQRLAGLRILVVEDEFYIADDVARALEGAGAQVVGPVPTLARAEEQIGEDGFDFAILDLNLHGENGVQIAERLAAQHIPFVFATGYGSPSVPDRFSHVPKCEKPFDPGALVGLVARTVAKRAT